MVYEYDFGDSWEHEVLLEKILPRAPKVRYPVVTAGRRACPPEDVGGVWGYADFLKAIADPRHPSHEEMVEWAGEGFDPEAFDVGAANRDFHGGWAPPPKWEIRGHSWALCGCQIAKAARCGEHSMDKRGIVSGEWVRAVIRDFIAGSPLNTMRSKGAEPAWDDVLVGFASGADPIWQQYKEYVGPFHWTPWEVFNQHWAKPPAAADELTVVSWVLPQREVVRKANRKARKFPSEEWARVRIYGEEFNAALRRHVAERLTRAGHPAVAPMLAPNWTIVTSQRFSYASSWSERHAAHAAGLGTFGLCDGLITARGKAMRVGSVVARMKIPPTPRPYAEHRAYCLFFADGTCGKCIDRCPARAISKAGHDKEKCRQHLVRAREHVKKTYKFEGYGCGLCQVGVPCEAGIPVKAAREALERGELPPPPPLA